MTKLSTIYDDVVWYRGSNSGHYLSFKIDGNDSEEFGPGLYYTDSYDLAAGYGDVKEFKIDTSVGFYKKGDKVNRKIIKSIISYADSDHYEVSLSNWNENPKIAYTKLFNYIIGSKDMPEAIVRLYFDLFRYDREDFWMSCKAAGVYGLIYDDPYDSGRSMSFLVLFDPKKARQI